MQDAFILAFQRWIEIFMRRSMSNFIQYLKQNGYSMSQMTSMFHILHHPNCSVSDLAEHLDVSKAAASQLTERLVQQGLLIRSEDPGDRRNKCIALTDKGRATAVESMRARQMWISQLENTLSIAEKEQIINALDLLTSKTNTLDQNNEQICPVSKA